MTPVETILIEAICRTLGADSVQVIYAFGIGVDDIHLNAGEKCLDFACRSPFDWEGSMLPRRRDYQGFAIFDSVCYGPFGSGSLLSAKVRDSDSFSDDLLLAQHIRLHSGLDGNQGSGLAITKLKKIHKEVLAMAAYGLTSEETAIQLKITKRAVERLVDAARIILGSATKTEAVYRATITRQLGKLSK